MAVLEKISKWGKGGEKGAIQLIRFCSDTTSCYSECTLTADLRAHIAPSGTWGEGVGGNARERQ